MKKILTYKLFAVDFEEVFNTVKDILLEIEDMGISTGAWEGDAKSTISGNSSTDYSKKMKDKKVMIFSIPCSYEKINNEIRLKNETEIILTPEIIDVIERVKDYCHSVGYNIVIFINDFKYDSNLLNLLRPPVNRNNKKYSIDLEIVKL